MLEPLDAGETVAVDLVQPAKVSGQRVRFALDALATEILEQIVVRVHAIECRVCWMRLVKVAEQIIDKVREWLRSYHRFQRLKSWASPGITIRQWYNKDPR